MHKRCTIHADIATWERRHWMIDEIFGLWRFSRNAQLWCPMRGIIYCAIFTRYISLKSPESQLFIHIWILNIFIQHFAWKCCDFESQFPQVPVNRFPWFKFGRKCDYIIWWDAKYQDFTWPWTWPHSSLKWSCISHVLPVNGLSRNSDCFPKFHTLSRNLKKYIHSINMTPIYLKSPFN